MGVQKPIWYIQTKKGNIYQDKWCARWGVLCGMEKYREGIGGAQNEKDQCQSRLRSNDSDWGVPIWPEERAIPGEKHQKWEGVCSTESNWGLANQQKEHPWWLRSAYPSGGTPRRGGKECNNPDWGTLLGVDELPSLLLSTDRRGFAPCNKIEELQSRQWGLRSVYPSREAPEEEELSAEWTRSELS